MHEFKSIQHNFALSFERFKVNQAHKNYDKCLQRAVSDRNSKNQTTNSDFFFTLNTVVSENKY